jgi:hypothetical protein
LLEFSTLAVKHPSCEPFTSLAAIFVSRDLEIVQIGRFADRVSWSGDLLQELRYSTLLPGYGSLGFFRLLAYDFFDRTAGLL